MRSDSPAESTKRFVGLTRARVPFTVFAPDTKVQVEDRGDDVASWESGKSLKASDLASSRAPDLGLEELCDEFASLGFSWKIGEFFASTFSGDSTGAAKSPEAKEG